MERRSKSVLGELPETFYSDVQKYVEELKANNDFSTLVNVSAIVTEIYEKRKFKIITKALSDTYASKDLTDVDQLVPNIIFCEGALYIKIKKALEEYDYYLKKECDIL